MQVAPRKGDLVTVTREEIRFAFLYILGREPESEHVYNHFAPHRDVDSLRRDVLGSPEGQANILSFLKMSKLRSFLDSNRSTVCFIHLEKTGGTTLQRILEKQFDPCRRSPSHLSMYSFFSSPVAKLSSYDFISGHLDYAATLALPGGNIKRLAIFREPRERLISFYRFHRAHPVSSRNKVDMEFVALAQDLNPIEFFQHKYVLCSPRTNNTYLRTFGSSLALPIDLDTDKNTLVDAFDTAKARIQGLNAIGITERMKESVTLICNALGFAPPEKIHSTHRTDEFAGQQKGFTRPEPVERSEALDAAMAPLVSMDLKLYDIVQQIFVERLKEINLASPGSESGTNTKSD